MIVDNVLHETHYCGRCYEEWTSAQLDTFGDVTPPDDKATGLCPRCGVPCYMIDKVKRDHR